MTASLAREAPVAMHMAVRCSPPPAAAGGLRSGGRAAYNKTASLARDAPAEAAMVQCTAPPASAISGGPLGGRREQSESGTQRDRLARSRRASCDTRGAAVGATLPQLLLGGRGREQSEGGMQRYRLAGSQLESAVTGTHGAAARCRPPQP